MSTKRGNGTALGVHGVHKWNFLMRTAPNIEHRVGTPRKKKKKKIPALSDRRNLTAREKFILELLAFTRGVAKPSTILNPEFQNSIKLIASLTQFIAGLHAQPGMREQKRIRNEITNTREAKPTTERKETLVTSREKKEEK